MTIPVDAITLDGNSPAAPLTGAEIFAFIQAGGDVSGTASQILTYINANAQLSESQITNLVTDLSAKLSKSGGTMTGNLLLNGNATQPLQAVPYQQLQTLQAGLNPKQPCQWATTTNLNATYSNGSSGVGATLTSTANQQFTTDGGTPTLNDRVYVLNQTNAAQNGIYVLTNQGSTGSQWVLTRATDYDNSATGTIATGDYAPVENGNTYGGTTWYLNTSGAITLGSTNLTYSQIFFTMAGTGLVKSNPNTLAINNTTVTAGTYPAHSNKTVQFTVNAQGQLTAALDGAIIPISTQWVVGTDATLYPYTSVQAAINAAGAVATSTNQQFVLVTPGTYTENITRTNSNIWVHLIGVTHDGMPINATSSSSTASPVIINGNHLDSGVTTANTFICQGIQFVNPIPGVCFYFESSVTQYIINNVVLNGVNGAIPFQSDAGSGLIQFKECKFLATSSTSSFTINSGNIVMLNCACPDSVANNVATVNGTLTIYGNLFVDVQVGGTLIVENGGIGAGTTNSAINFTTNAGVAKVFNSQVNSNATSGYWATSSGVPLGGQLTEGNNIQLGSAKYIQPNITVTYAGYLGKHFASVKGALYPTITNGATLVQTESTTNKNNARMFQFAQSGTSIVEGRMFLEKSISKASFTFKISWKTSTATTGNVVWIVDAIFRNAGDTEDTAFGTQVTLTSSASSPAQNTIITAESSAVTPRYPSGSANTTGILEFRLQRQGGVGSDTLADVANLVDIELGLTEIAGNDS